MNKKGIIVIQFNWIYVLVVGGLILALFIGVIMKQQTASEIVAAGELQRKLETMLTGATASVGTVNVVDLGRTKIGFDCYGYSISDQLEPFDPGITFAPSEIDIKGRQFITWTLGWDAPYRVTGFLYVTSKQVRYIIVGDPSDPVLQEINKTLPEELNKEIILRTSPVRDKNNYKIKFVYVGLEPSHNIQNLKGDISAISVQGQAIKFYDTRNRQFRLRDEVNFVGMSELYAAIFADTFESYECNIKEAYNRLNLITAIYIYRTYALRNSYTNGTECFNIYDSSPLNALNTIAIAADQASKGDMAAVASIVAAAAGLRNRDLQLFSCPLIY